MSDTGAAATGGPAETSWAPDALPRDTMLHGYRIVGILGRGGFGITYRAVDGIDQVFAIKEYFPRQFATREAAVMTPAGEDGQAMFDECLERFTREARALTLFSGQTTSGQTTSGQTTSGQTTSGQHGGDGVVRVITYFEANGTAYIVMEYVAGQGLDRLIAANPKGIPPAALMHIVQILVPALGRVHAAGLLHRDIKPANIFLRDGRDPVLLDFGAARVHQPGQTEAFTQIFTERYAPIEQVHGVTQGPYSDIYALGVTFYQCIAGSDFTARGKGSTIRHAALQTRQADPMPPAVEVGAGRYPERVLRAIDAALRVAPGERPQDIAAFSALLGLGGEPDVPRAGDDLLPTRVIARNAAAEAETRPASPATGLPKTPAAAATAPKSPLVPLLIGGTLLALAAVGAFVWTHRPKPAQDSAAWQIPQPQSPPPAQTPIAVAPTPSTGPADIAYAAGHYPEAMQAYRTAARGGDAHAQYRLGAMLQNGQGAAADPAAALAWYRKAADRNSAAAQSQIGYFFLSGLGVTRNDEEALRWYRMAAAQHFAVAEYQLGYMAQHGLGMPRDFSAMLDWYRMAAGQGSAEAQQQLGYCYQMGLGVPADPRQAFGWYQQAADRHLASAMYSLGQMYFGGLGVTPDTAAGRNWIARAAAAGSSDARQWLATH